MSIPVLNRIAAPARPDEAPQALPGDELEAIGTAFGNQGGQSAVQVTAQSGTVLAATIVSWRNDRVRFVFPDGLGAPGPKPVRVRNRDGSSAAVNVTLEEPARLSAAPVALLPLLVQTRFMAQGGELWVRAIPDTIHLDSHDERLTAEEVALGQRYRDAGDGRDDAWLDLTTRFGVPRAEWIVRATLSGTVTTRAEPWARAARSRLLPRRLHVFAFDDAGTVIASQYGRPVPFELPIGPDPEADDDADPTTDPGMRWLISFPDAQNRGMAVKLTLPTPAPTRIAKVVVLGVETALSPQAAAGELAGALLAHRYTDGVGFLNEGTPTNVTPSAPVDPEPVGADRPADAPSPLAEGTNAAEAARALGLGDRAAEVFSGTPNAGDGARLRDARTRLNAALWPATWGYFLNHMFAPDVSEEDAEAARRHFTAWVRGCGPQPTLRIGTQPYGLLPVLPMNRWTAVDEEPPVARLATFLQGTLRPIWRASTVAVPRVADTPDPDSTRDNPLLTVLSMQPTSVSFRGRSVLGLDFVDAAWRFIRNRLTTGQLLGPAWKAEHAALTRAALEAHGLGDLHPYLERTVFATNYFPVPFPLVQDGGAPDQPLSVDWLSVLNGSGWRDLRDDAFDLPGLTERPLLYLLLRHSLLAAYLFAAGAMDPPDPWRGGEEVLHGIDEIEDNLDAPRPGLTWDRLASKGVQLDAVPRPPLSDVRDGIAGLVGAPVDVLERAAAEALDLCSHRLDAWITSYAQRRLRAIRGATGAGGVHLGAYGVVEDIETGYGDRSAGYVHTPSLAHASAAAILASGFLSHSDGGTRHPFGIDLSSARVRTALSLLDGVRAGQPLGALLGYRFERALQQGGLARFIDDFRTLSPLPVTGSATVSAGNVVDALELHRLWVAAGRTQPDAWPGSTARTPLQAVFNDLDDAVDAVGDILLTEGVFQLGRGNAERASAALHAAAQPSGTPPELEAIYTPHAGTAVIHRLAVLLPGELSSTPGWNQPASLARRSAAEPRLNAWAARVLFDPERIRYRVRYLRASDGHLFEEQERHLDDLVPAISPLDLVYAAAANAQSQLSEVEQRITYHALRTRPNNVPADAVVRVLDIASNDEDADEIGIVEAMELAQSLRETLTGARAVGPDDLSLPDAPGTAAVDVAEAESRATAAVSTLRSADTALGTAITGETLRTALFGALAFGVPGAVPVSAFGDTAADRAELGVQAATVQAEVRRRIAAVDGLTVPPASDVDGRVAYAVARLETVFGNGFRVVPRYQSPPRDDRNQVNVSFPASGSLQGGDEQQVIRWFQRLTRVREGAQRLGDLLLYADALGGEDPARFEVAQLPATPGVRWLALPFANGTPPAGRVSVVAHLPAGAPDPDRRFAGLVVEHFTEVLPAPAKTTGLALHYDQPNAAPPQAIVLAVPPRPNEDWTLEKLRDVVLDTLDLAKIRMVDLDALREAGQFVPATYLGFNAKGVTVATDFLSGRGIPLG